MIQAKKRHCPKPIQDDENSVMTKDTDDSILTGLDGDESTCMSTSKRGSDEEEEKDDESGNEYDENQSVKEHDGEREVGCNYLNELVADTTHTI